MLQESQEHKADKVVLAQAEETAEPVDSVEETARVADRVDQERMQEEQAGGIWASSG